MVLQASSDFYFSKFVKVCFMIHSESVLVNIYKFEKNVYAFVLMS